jgi:hypothetical protein
MSAAYTDDELLAQIRGRVAFEGMLITSMLTAAEPLKPLLQEHFKIILEAIDGKQS